MSNRRIPRIVVIGSLNVDLITVVDRMPAPGETIFGREFHLGFGGKGGNQAAAARLCGAEVAMIGRVGDDLFASATIDDLAGYGIETTHVTRTPGTSTGVAPIFVDSSGQNRILVVKGANDRLSPDDVDAARPLIQSAHIVLLQLEIPLDTVYHAISVARQQNVPVILNPAPAQSLEVGQLAGIEYFIPNENEAESLTGQQVGDIEDARGCAGRLLQSGLKHVVITLGGNGALYASPGASYHIPGFDVQSVDTTGAGDAFIGSFAYCIAAGFQDREAVARANLYAALSTLGPGTRRAFPTREQWMGEWLNRFENSGGQEDDRADQREHPVYGDSHDSKRQQKQPDDRVQNQSG